MSHSLYWNIVEVYNPACRHWRGIYQPLMLNFTDLHLASALLWVSFVILGKLLAVFPPAFTIWYWQVIGCYLRGKILLWFTTTNISGSKGERDLRVPSVSNIPGERNSVATVQCTRESMGLSSMDSPLQSWAPWIGRRIVQMRIERKTEDWQFTSCRVKWFHGFLFLIWTKTMPANNINFALLTKTYPHTCLWVFWVKTSILRSFSTWIVLCTCVHAREEESSRLNFSSCIVAKGGYQA